MAWPAPNFDRFLGRLHRRLVIARVVERTGLGLLLGAAAAGVALPVLWARQADTVTPALGLMGLLGLAGAIYGAANRPRVIDAAAEADGQLGLSDLLTSALTVDAADADPFAQAVRAAAEARCAMIGPADVVLSRWGARAWGGVGVSMALVMTLSFMAAGPVETRADQRQLARSPLAVLGADAARPARADGGGGLRVDGSKGPLPGAVENPFDTRPEDATGAGKVEDGAGRTSAADPAGRGGGSGVGVPRKAIGEVEAGAPGKGSVGDDAGDRATGGAGRGDGGAGQDGALDGAGATARGGTEDGVLSAGDRARAGAAVRAGAVPEAYRDVVKAYFGQR